MSVRIAGTELVVVEVPEEGEEKKKKKKNKEVADLLMCLRGQNGSKKSNENSSDFLVDIV
jgi:hypothetical protein